MPKFLGACCALLMMSCSLLAQGNSPNKPANKPPRIPFDLAETPLDKAMKQLNGKIDEKIKDKAQNPACLKALSDPEDPNDKHGKKRDIAAKCQLMQTKHEDAFDKDEKIKDARGRTVGRKLKKVHTVFLDHPSRRSVDSDNPPAEFNKWDKIVYAGRPFVDLAGADRVKNPSSIRVHSSMLPASDGKNDDFDCIDRATNKHLQGTVNDGQGNISHPCFQDFENRVLFNPLVLQDDGTYKHPSGRIYTADEYAELPSAGKDSLGQDLPGRTTLQELVDEDSNIGASAGVDDDGDGLIDEDGPTQGAANTVCGANGGVPVADPANPNAESCDFTNGVQQRIQEEGKKHNGNEGKKFFQMDDNNVCDPDPKKGLYPCGEEPREIEVEETIALRCPPNAEYDDDGRCRVPNDPQALASAIGAESVFANTTSTTDQAMMGFTFAPPVLEWGINERWRVCVFGICFEVFGIRFGYEFDVAAGLRLPVEVKVNDIPTEVIAEDTATLPVAMTPMDFRVNDYTAFCQRHNLDRSWWISDCNRFAFPEYFASMLPDDLFEPAGNRQGSEFVAQTSIFAGLQVRVFTVPVVDFAIDSSVNIPAMCTLKKMKDQLSSPAEWVKLLATFGKDMTSEQGRLDAKQFIKSLEENLGNCATFTTPWGNDENGSPRQFPFLTTGVSIPADCIKARVDAIAVGGESKPMCTGLKVNIYGATLGLGLELIPEANSKLITAKANATGDASMNEQTVNFEYGAASPSIRDVAFDNFDTASKSGTITIDDFTYYLNNFGVQVNGIIELGGILSFIGNVATVPLVHLSFDTGTYGIPIPQHPGTGPVTIGPIPVTNYALSVDAGPSDSDPMRADADTLRINPGTPGEFQVRVRNEGTKVDTIDGFKFILSNRSITGGSYGVVFNHNNDFDCKDDVTGAHYFGYPYDGVADDCYDAAGNTLAGRTEQIDEDGNGDSRTGDGSAQDRDRDQDGLADEDPAGDDWLASFTMPAVADVPAETTNNTNVLSVIPFAHPLTRPGDYPVKVMADSKEARLRALHSPDKSGLARLGAEDTVIVRIESFFDPQVQVLPPERTAKPGGQVTYEVEAVNGGNQNDQIAMLAIFGDSDTLGCTLTTNGRAAGCPYRALMTRIDPAVWTTVAELDTFFPPAGSYVPLGNGRDSLTIRAPSDWAGMQDTVYEFTLKATSTADSAVPKATKEFKANFTITATKESMTRYLNLEIAEFMAEIDKVNAAGVKTRGIQPVMFHPVTMMTDKALAQITAGDLAGASKSLSSASKVMEAVARMVAGAGLPEPIGSDWNARSAAILADMTSAQAWMIQ